ncbi:toll/interleukin-1 receptor domain-containing protein [Rhodoferax sp.]|uniref:toll/interleukin-1 receptor domain-containing protein n=1 Tax=Rhodoferax sp. TaxID=50421 RepID=UPI002ACE4D16|nr:toll/interleukin-1 receptor domain-containing protein [Rhodoferax sp.]MDZ7921678.1 toll/interleukin-1 receptor domain-containing protein [Rhodoferax sp.]
MTLSIAELRSAASRPVPVIARSINEARTLGVKTAFLCHSHQDAELAKGLVQLMAATGWRVYIDWQDTAMPSTPNAETAERIKQKIRDLGYFIFLATENSMASRWCPWEIGYADGKKQIDQIFIVPTTDGTRTHGNEYLQLYRKIDRANNNELAAWMQGQSTGTFVKNL